MTTLSVESASKSYRRSGGDVSALTDVSVRLDEGEFVAVQGASGCGKSTLLLLAGGLLAPDAGTVAWEGKDIYALDAGERARLRARKVGFVFQQFHLIPYLSVLDNVLAASLAWRRDGEPREAAAELLARLGLEYRSNHVPSELSVGERQRAALARALLNRPSLLLADEPTGNLDEENGEAVLRHLAGFATDGGAVLLVTHDPKAARFAHRGIHMRDGRIEARSGVGNGADSG